jgi:hypothetical protein
MPSHRFSPWGPTGLVVALLLAFSVTTAVSDVKPSSAPRAAQAPAVLEATIFTFDGQDFVRAKTTLVTEAGKSAANTKLEHDTPAFKALIQKHSFTGAVTVFGKHYDAQYAPMIDKDGRLTGALFIAVPK